MANVVIDDIGLGMGRYLKTRRDLVAPERSPIRTTIFALVVLAGVVLLVLAITDPEMFTRDTGRRRGRSSPMTAYIASGAIILLGLVGAIFWSRRWRVPGGGKLRIALAENFTAIDPNEVWAVLDNATSANDPALLDILRRIQQDKKHPGAFSLDVMHSPADRLAIATVTRAILKKADDPQSGLRHQLEREATVFRGERYVDFEALLGDILKTAPASEGGYA